MKSSSFRNRNKLMLLEERATNLLIAFVNTDMDKTDFMRRTLKIHREILKFSNIVKKNDLGNALQHELYHKQILDKYGVKSEFRIDILGTRSVEDVDLHIVSKDFTKKKIIEILKEVSFEPFRLTKDFAHCYRDLVTFEILSGHIKNFPLTAKDKNLLKRKYST